MYSASRLAAKFIRYYITASNGKGHGIHSPFVFDFIIHVLNDKRNFYAYQQIEQLRNELIADERILEIDDFGAGTVSGNKKQRKLSDIARRVAKSPKLGKLLLRIANYYQPSVMLELGTSLGLSAAYLSSGNPAAKLITCEGASAVAAVARENFYRLQLNNIKVIEGNFDDTLPGILQSVDNIDVAFIDGNHRKQPTLDYFEQLLQKKNSQSILIFDDIHWSAEMEEAWAAIKNHPSVMLTVDLFFIGIVFFNPDFKVKQDFIIRF
ncbi:MAG: class I SAM-dependent methyltransferase [Chitinophagaceae bacterium]